MPIVPILLLILILLLLLLLLLPRQQLLLLCLQPPGNGLPAPKQVLPRTAEVGAHARRTRRTRPGRIAGYPPCDFGVDVGDGYTLSACCSSDSV